MLLDYCLAFVYQCGAIRSTLSCLIFLPDPALTEVWSNGVLAIFFYLAIN